MKLERTSAPLKITLCSITLLAPNQNSNAKTVAFHHRAPLPVCFPPSPKESHSRGYLPNLKALSPTSKTYRISNQVLKTGTFFFSTLKAFPQKIFGATIDAQIGHDFLSLSFRTSLAHDRSWVVRLVNCPRGFRHGTPGDGHQYR